MTDVLQPAYLLHARDYRDNCLLVELFTPAGGRIGAVARGARRVSKRGTSQRAILQPFQPLWIELFGSGELKTLRQVESRAAPLALRGHALFSALYVNELLCRVVHRDDAQPQVFEGYDATLQRLTYDPRLDIVLRQFELALLDALGYGFDLALDAGSGTALLTDAHYRFDPQQGLLRSPNQPGAFSGADLLAFAAGDYSDAARRALKLLCRQALRPHLGDKPLRSRQLFGA